MPLDFGKISELADKPIEVICPIGLTENDNDPFTVKFNILTPKKIEKILKKHSKFKYKGGQKIRDVEDRDAFEEILDNAISSWSGLIDKAGNNVPCLKENKVALCDASSDILNWITEQIDELSQTANRSKDVEVKNSKAS